MTRVGAANVAPPPPPRPPLAAPDALRPPPAAPRHREPRPRGAGRAADPRARWPSSRPSSPARSPARAATRRRRPPAKTASNADLDLQYEAPWAPGGSPDAVPGLTLTRPITLRAGDGSIVAGRIAKPGPGLLPAGMTRPRDRHGLARAPPRPSATTGVAAEGGAAATVFVVPTDRGPEAIACVGVATSRCEAVAATLHLRTGRRARRRAQQGLRRRPRQAAARPERARAQPTAARWRAPRPARRRRRRGLRRAAPRPRWPRRRARWAPTWPRAANDAVAAAIAGIARGYKHLGAAARKQDAARYRAAERRAAPGARGPRARDQRAEAARLPRPARWLRCASRVADRVARGALRAGRSRPSRSPWCRSTTTT